MNELDSNIEFVSILYLPLFRFTSKINERERERGLLGLSDFGRIFDSIFVNETKERGRALFIGEIREKP